MRQLSDSVSGMQPGLREIDTKVETIIKYVQQLKRERSMKLEGGSTTSGQAGPDSCIPGCVVREGEASIELCWLHGTSGFVEGTCAHYLTEGETMPQAHYTSSSVVGNA